MRMGLFWGIVLMLIGLLIIVNIVFQINLPIFKVILAFFLIYLGVRILIGGSGAHGARNQSHETAFGERTFTASAGGRNHYDVVFGRAVIDLRNLPLQDKLTQIQVTAVFGKADIWLDRNTPVKIESDVAFGGAQLPDRHSGGFGSVSYVSENFDSATNALHLRTTAVFGGVVAEYH